LGFQIWQIHRLAVGANYCNGLYRFSHALPKLSLTKAGYHFNTLESTRPIATKQLKQDKPIFSGNADFDIIVLILNHGRAHSASI
jgi:hypothetical protein